MRTTVYFLACLVPLAGALWWAGRDDEEVAELPDMRHEPRPAVLRGSDFAHENEEAPFPGRIRRLEDIAVKVVDKGYVQFYLRVERLARTDDKPHLDAVTCAVFDPPVDGKPRLRLTFHAPYVWGDPRELLDPRKDRPKTARLGGGVVVRDQAGRTLAEIESVTIDITGRTVRSDAAVSLSVPERGLHVTGEGMSADIDLRRARIERRVAASVDARGAKASVSCAGAATAVELEEGRFVRIAFEEAVRFEHPLGSVRCDNAVVDVVKADDAFVLEQATLTGGVRLELAEDGNAGIESVASPRVVVSGTDRVVCEGPLRAVRRGPLEAFGIGERLLDIEAAGAAILLRRDGKDKVTVEEARFERLKAVDRAGAGHISAALVTYVAEGQRLVAEGAVEARTPDGFLAADTLAAARTGDKSFQVTLRGDKRIEYVADGELGPLGSNARGRLHFTANGAIDVAVEGERVRMRARDGVVARVDEEDARLEAGDVSLVVVKGGIEDFRATGKVRLVGNGSVAEGDSLTFTEKVARLTGAPASVVTGDARNVRARELDYHETGFFRAEGDVVVRARVQSGVWTIRCDRATGELGPPRLVVATGGVSARGPAGEVVTGEEFGFDDRTGRAVLKGAPARVRQGDDLAVRADGFDLVLKDGAVVEARTLSAGAVEVRSKRVPGLEKSSIDAWRVDLRGPVLFRKNRVEIPAGAGLLALDAEGKEILKASANRVVVDLEETKEGPRPTRLVGSGGVEVEDRAGEKTRVTAKTLEYETGSRKVHVHGRVRVEAPGWPAEVRFGHVVFVVLETGIDLKRASEIEGIERPARRAESAK